MVIRRYPIFNIKKKPYCKMDELQSRIKKMGTQNWWGRKYFYFYQYEASYSEGLEEELDAAIVDELLEVELDDDEG